MKIKRLKIWYGESPAILVWYEFNIIGCGRIVLKSKLLVRNYLTQENYQIGPICNFNWDLVSPRIESKHSIKIDISE